MGIPHGTMSTTSKYAYIRFHKLSCNLAISCKVLGIAPNVIMISVKPDAKIYLWGGDLLTLFKVDPRKFGIVSNYGCFLGHLIFLDLQPGTNDE